MLSRVVVFGVTGVQGGSCARALLADKGKFEVIGITRNKTSRGSQAVAKEGVQLVEGDLNDPSSYESALKDADGMFLNANFWAAYKGNNSEEAKEIEIKQCKGAVDAAKRAGVKFIVYSALESYKPRQELHHFDSKAEIVDYIKSTGIPATYLYASYYFSNLLSAKIYEKEGKTILPLPMPDNTVLPGFNPEQIGLWARVAFRDPKEWAGKNIDAIGQDISIADICKELTKATGKEWDCEHHTKDEFMALKGKLDDELWLNYLAFVNGEMKRDLKESKRLVPEADDFAAWLKSSKDAQEKWGVKV